MAIEIGNVTRVEKAMRGTSSWGFSLRDSTARPARFATITYQTQSEAETAREQIRAAIVNAIDVSIGIG
jgi:hypothetical protein